MRFLINYGPRVGCIPYFPRPRPPRCARSSAAKHLKPATTRTGKAGVKLGQPTRGAPPFAPTLDLPARSRRTGGRTAQRTHWSRLNSHFGGGIHRWRNQFPLAQHALWQHQDPAIIKLIRRGRK